VCVFGGSGCWCNFLRRQERWFPDDVELTENKAALSEEKMKAQLHGAVSQMTGERLEKLRVNLLDDVPLLEKARSFDPNTEKKKDALVGVILV
jgi:hypothetical protein